MICMDDNTNNNNNMVSAAPDLNLSAFKLQVESVLSDLVKVATVELTKVLESRYRALVLRRLGAESPPQPPPPAAAAPAAAAASSSSSSCSVGVQVDGLLSTQTTAEEEPPGHLNLSGMADCLETKVEEEEEEEDEEEEEEEGVSTADLLTEEEHVDHQGLLVKENEVQGTANREPQTRPPRCDKDAVGHDHSSQRPGSSPSSSPPEPPLRPVKQEEESEVIAIPDRGLRDVGASCSPSPSDPGAAFLALPLPRVEAWECVSPAREDATQHSDLQVRLKRNLRGLVRPCSVQLVNIHAATKLPCATKSVAAGRHVTTSSASSSASSPSRPKDLRRHQGLHTGHRLCCYEAGADGVWRLQGVVARAPAGYACHVCGQSFKRRKILRRHERFHTGERPYACSRCAKTFALRKSLRRHERFHTGERPHDCAQCGKSFRLRENLKAHLRFHSGEKPYVCSVCGKTFRIARNLEKHSMDQCGFLLPSSSSRRSSSGRSLVSWSAEGSCPGKPLEAF